MAKKWIALNILLLAAAVGLAREFYQRYEQLKAENDPAKIGRISAENPEAAKAAPGVSADVLAETPNQADDDYFIISEKTLFSDLRGGEDVTLAVAPKPTPLPNPKPTLVGTIMIDGQYTASVINPTVQQRGVPNAPETWRVGDSFRGFKVTAIEAEQMVLENGDIREFIPLNRTARRAQAARPTVASSATRVVSIGPGGKASGAINVVTATASAGSGRAATRPGQPPPGQQVQGPGQPPQGQVRISSGDMADIAITEAWPENAQPEPQVRPAQKPGQKPQPEVGARPAPGVRQQRVVRSPFGDIIRPGSE